MQYTINNIDKNDKVLLRALSKIEDEYDLDIKFNIILSPSEFDIAREKYIKEFLDIDLNELGSYINSCVIHIKNIDSDAEKKYIANTINQHFGKKTIFEYSNDEKIFINQSIMNRKIFKNATIDYTHMKCTVDDYMEIIYDSYNDYNGTWFQKWYENKED